MESEGSGLMMLKSLPHGFYECQLLDFFSQFGTVEYVRVLRSRRSGLSSGMAYVQFQFPEVAKIASDSMDQYFLFGKTLRCAIKSTEWLEQHPNLFSQQHSADFIKKRKRNGFLQEKDKRLSQRKRKAMKESSLGSYDSYMKKCKMMVKADQKLSKKLKEAGIEYEYPPLVITPEMEEEWKRDLEFAKTETTV